MAFGGEYPHPKYLADVLTARDVGDWNVYAEREPFGLDDQQFGLLRALVAAAAGVKEVDPSMFSIAGIIRHGQAMAEAGEDFSGPSLAQFDRIVTGRAK